MHPRSVQKRTWTRTLTLAGLTALISLNWSCSALKDICNCVPYEPNALDYRHDAKHVPLPAVTPVEITVQTILTWPQTPVLPPNTPRSGRELTLFHVAHAFLQNASVNTADCDVHLEISATSDPKTPRVIVETPVDSEYCSARKNIQSQLAQHGVTLDATHGGDLPRALPAEVTGLAFEDFEHPQSRGTPEVATLWELHPAIVTITH